MQRLLTIAWTLLALSATAQHTATKYAADSRLQLKVGAGYFVRISTVRTAVANDEVKLKLRSGFYQTAEVALGTGGNQYVGLVYNRSMQQASFDANGNDPEAPEGIVEEGIFYTGLIYSYQMSLDKEGRNRLHASAGVGILTHTTSVQRSGNQHRSRALGYSTAVSYERRFTKAIGAYTELSMPAGCTTLLNEDNNLSQVRLAAGLLIRIGNRQKE